MMRYRGGWHARATSWRPDADDGGVSAADHLPRTPIATRVLQAPQVMAVPDADSARKPTTMTAQVAMSKASPPPSAAPGSRPLPRIFT